MHMIYVRDNGKGTLRGPRQSVGNPSIGSAVSKNRQHPFAQRRFWIVFAIAFLLVCVFSGAVIKVYASSAGSEPVPHIAVKAADNDTVVKNEASRFIHVSQGDTLWDIAAAYAPGDGNVRSYLEDIKKTNGLKSSQLQVGQKLLLP